MEKHELKVKALDGALQLASMAGEHRLRSGAAVVENARTLYGFLADEQLAAPPLPENERVARRLHAMFLADHAGTAVTAEVGALLVPWEELEEETKEQYRTIAHTVYEAIFTAESGAEPPEPTLNHRAEVEGES